MKKRDIIYILIIVTLLIINLMQLNTVRAYENYVREDNVQVSKLLGKSYYSLKEAFSSEDTKAIIDKQNGFSRDLFDWYKKRSYLKDDFMAIYDEFKELEYESLDYLETIEDDLSIENQSKIKVYVKRYRDLYLDLTDYLKN